MGKGRAEVGWQKGLTKVRQAVDSSALRADAAGHATKGDRLSGAMGSAKPHAGRRGAGRGRGGGITGAGDFKHMRSMRSMRSNWQHNEQQACPAGQAPRRWQDSSRPLKDGRRSAIQTPACICPRALTHPLPATCDAPATPGRQYDYGTAIHLAQAARLSLQLGVCGHG